MSASILRTQISPMNQQMLDYYLSQKDYVGATTQYLSSLNKVMARNRLPVSDPESLRQIYAVTQSDGEWSNVDRATLMIFQATARNPDSFASAKKLLIGDESDLGKALRAYCDAKTLEHC